MNSSGLFQNPSRARDDTAKMISGGRSRAHPALSVRASTGVVLLMLCSTVTSLGWSYTSSPELPSELQQWKSAEHSARYILKVEAPPLAGSIELQPFPTVAHVYLPLKLFEPDSTPEHASGSDAEAKEDVEKRIESILLVGEDGAIHPIFQRSIKNGNDVEIAFPTRSGFRRYCLYVGAKDGYAQKFSTLSYRPESTRVRLLGQLAPASFRGAENAPLTFEKFLQLPRSVGRNNETKRPAMDDPEPPFQYNSGETQDYVARYEGFLRAPVRGTYGFAITTTGAAVLSVDGVELISEGKGDTERPPLALQAFATLEEGLHRVTLFYAQLDHQPGIRLYWRPPFSDQYIVISPHSFGRALPAVVTGMETQSGEKKPFIHVEVLGHARSGLHRGLDASREWLLLMAKATRPSEIKGTLQFQTPSSSALNFNGNAACAWVPANEVTHIRFSYRDATNQDITLAAREFRWPVKSDGVDDVVEVTGELQISALPQFLYPDETAQVHLEATLSPIPLIYTKVRQEHGPVIPMPQPAGDFKLAWSLINRKTEKSNSLGMSGSRLFYVTARQGEKIRIPLDAKKLLREKSKGFDRIQATLTVGGVPVDSLTAHILHSRESWPAGIAQGFNRLYLPSETKETKGAAGSEPLVIIVPREHEASYRRFQLPLIKGTSKAAASEILFLGDPLVGRSAVEPNPDPAGLPADLKKALPDRRWLTLSLPGPYRGWYVFQLIAEAEKYRLNRPDQKLPPWVIVSLGGNDAQRQTPLYHFERGLDVLIDRLRVGGARQIVFVGSIPEPGRLEQGRPYQIRWADLVRQHHLESLDIFSLWTSQKDWQRRFRLQANDASTYTPWPDSESIKEIATALKKLIP